MKGDSMAEAHHKDYAAKAKYDALIRAIAAIFSDDEVSNRLSVSDCFDLETAKVRMERQSDRIVRAWD